jgi:hypothetical protein
MLLGMHAIQLAMLGIQRVTHEALPEMRRGMFATQLAKRPMTYKMQLETPLVNFVAPPERRYGTLVKPHGTYGERPVPLSIPAARILDYGSIDRFPMV